MNNYYAFAQMIAWLAVWLLVTFLTVAPILIAEGIIPVNGSILELPAVRQEAVSLTVLQDAMVSNDPDYLATIMEFTWNVPEQAEAMILLSINEGSLWAFGGGEIVYPTGKVEYRRVIGATEKIIEVTSPLVAGKWWIFESQTK